MRAGRTGKNFLTLSVLPDFRHSFLRACCDIPRLMGTFPGSRPAVCFYWNDDLTTEHSDVSFGSSLSWMIQSPLRHKHKPAGPCYSFSFFESVNPWRGHSFRPQRVFGSSSGGGVGGCGWRQGMVHTISGPQPTRISHRGYDIISGSAANQKNQVRSTVAFVFLECVNNHLGGFGKVHRLEPTTLPSLHGEPSI